MKKEKIFPKLDLSKEGAILRASIRKEIEWAYKLVKKSKIKINDG